MAKPDLFNRLTSRLSSVPSSDVPPAAGLAEDRQLLAAADSGHAARVGLWALGIGLGGFLLWAALAPLDEGVPSQGLVSIDTKRKAVQHPTGGIVKEVLVGEGSRVKEGQLLIRLDEAATRANYEATRQHYMGLRAVQGRLLAEQSDAATITFHPDLISAGQDPLIRSQMVTQQQLFQSRKMGLRADMQAIQQNIQGQQAQISSYEGVLSSRRNQLGLINDELKQTRELVKEGYAPRNRQLELERMVADANGAIADDP